MSAVHPRVAAQRALVSRVAKRLRGGRLTPRERAVRVAELDAIVSRRAVTR